MASMNIDKIIRAVHDYEISKSSHDFDYLNARRDLEERVLDAVDED